MTRVNYIFGCWGLVNTAAFVVYAWCAVGGNPPSLSGWVIPVAILSMLIPFGQTAICCGKLGLNADEDSSGSERDRVLGRYKQIAKRTPVATALMVLCFPLVMILGATPDKRVLIGAAGILFSFAPAYVNLFVVRKCQDLFTLWGVSSAGTSEEQDGPIESVSRRDRLIAGGLCCVFLAVGVFAFTTLFVVPSWKVFQARSWNPTRCTILSSEFRDESDGDGTSYHLDVAYEYEVNEAVYRSDRFQFVGGGGAMPGQRREFAEAFPPGSTTTCYVNPLDPADAVLDRTMTPDIWMNALTLVFIVLGGGCLLLVTGVIGRKR